MSISRRAGCTRRTWCTGAGAGLLLAGIGCDSGSSPIDGGDGGAATGDLAQTGTSSCGAAVNAGAASAITAASPKLVSSAGTAVWVCRDASGLYAMSAACTHAGCTVAHRSAQFFCPCHGATFDLNGQNPTSPARQPLAHYAVCVDASGNMLVDVNTTVSPSQRA
jgi:Rieske Fe-S protein